MSSPHAAVLRSTRYQLPLDEQHRGQPVSHILQQLWPCEPPAHWQHELARGRVHLDGVRLTADAMVHDHSLLEYFAPHRTTAEEPHPLEVSIEPRVVFADDLLVCLYKPAHLSTCATRDQHQQNVRAWLERCFGRTVHLPSRLDTATSGLLVASIHPRGHSPLQHAFARGTVQKWYLLGSRAHPPWSALSLDAPVGREPGHPFRWTIRPDGRAARTTFFALPRPSQGAESVAGASVPEDSSVLLAQPLTGRTHQIRLHAAALGIPIIGDSFYGAPPVGQREDLQLFAFALQVWHPRRQRRLRHIAPHDVWPAWAAPHRPQVLHALRLLCQSASSARSARCTRAQGRCA